MIHDVNLPPGKWAMGRVVEVHPGNDRQIRVVTLKTKNGYIKRPITKLSILPIKTSHSNDSHTSIMQSEPNELAKHCISNKQTAATQKTNKCSRKFTLSSIVLTLLYFMSILSPSKAAFNITSFKKNQSLYLDPISKMQMISDKWTLIVYYDMSPYWEGVKAYEKITRHLNSTCLKTQNNNCNMIVLQLMHEYNELCYYNNILLTQQFSGRAPHARQRRGLINGIGYIASSLFGVLDERFAEQYTKDITNMKQNQAHLISLWKNQTSLVEAETNLLQRTAEIMQIHHKHINEQMISLKRAKDVLKIEVNNIATVQDFTLLSLSASNLIHNLKSTQDNLLDALTDIYRGQFQLHLLTPEQLIHELYIISGHVSSEVRLPISDLQKDIRKIYNLIKVKARMTKQYLLFEVTFPLVNRDGYKLYRVIPVPQQTNKTMVTVVPVADYIAVNIGKQTYLTMTYDELSLCTIHDGTYMCTQHKPVYRLTNNNNLCEMNLQTKQCEVRRTVCKNKWSPLSTTGQYLYFCCNEYTVKIICEEDVTMQHLRMAGIIVLAPNCMMKGDDFSLASHTIYQNQLNISPSISIPQIDHINHMINITLPEKDVNDTDSGELSSIIDQLKQQIKDIQASYSQPDYELSTHDIHQYAGISLILAGALVISAVVFWKRYTQQRGRRIITPDIELQSIAGNVARSTNSNRRAYRDDCTIEDGLQQPPNRVNKACSPINFKRTDLHF